MYDDNLFLVASRKGVPPDFAPATLTVANYQNLYLGFLDGVFGGFSGSTKYNDLYVYRPSLTAGIEFSAKRKYNGSQGAVWVDGRIFSRDSTQSELSWLWEKFLGVASLGKPINIYVQR